MSGRRGVANHWYWRPGWRLGRSFYTWHLTFHNQPGLHAHAAAYRAALVHLPGLDPVPDPWLHLTVQGMGFTDEVDRADVDVIAESAGEHLARVEPFTLQFGAPVVATEGVAWRLDTGAVAPVRYAIRAGIAEIWPSVPESESDFRAHVSLAYANADAPGEPIAAALAAVRTDPVTVAVQAAELIVLNRDRYMYEWETYATVPLAAP